MEKVNPSRLAVGKAQPTSTREWREREYTVLEVQPLALSPRSAAHGTLGCTFRVV